MTVAIIEVERFEQLEKNFQATMEKVVELAKEKEALRTKEWLTAKEAAELTGYNERTIRNKKNEIGYCAGQPITFRYSDLIEWKLRGYVAPKDIKYKR